MVAAGPRLAYVLLPWALTGRRPGVVPAAALVGAVLALGAVGVATLRSGLAGSVVPPISNDLALYVWIFVPPALLVRFAVAARGWTLAATIWLVLATPLVAAFSYAVGPYDAQPWWEAISGLLTATAGLCLLGAAVLTSRSRRHESAVTVATPAPRREAGTRQWSGLRIPCPQGILSSAAGLETKSARPTRPTMRRA